MEPKSAKQICLDAVSIIEKRGHCKYTYEHYDGSVCILGALNLAFHNSSAPRYASSNPGSQFTIATLKADEICLSKHGRSLQFYNDKQTTSKENIIALLNEVAQSLP